MLKAGDLIQPRSPLGCYFHPGEEPSGRIRSLGLDDAMLVLCTTEGTLYVRVLHPRYGTGHVFGEDCRVIV